MSPARRHTCLKAPRPSARSVGPAAVGSATVGSVPDSSAPRAAPPSPSPAPRVAGGAPLSDTGPRALPRPLRRTEARRDPCFARGAPPSPVTRRQPGLSPILSRRVVTDARYARDAAPGTAGPRGGHWSLGPLLDGSPYPACLSYAVRTSLLGARHVQISYLSVHANPGFEFPGLGKRPNGDNGEEESVKK